MALIDRFRRRAVRDQVSAGVYIDDQSFQLAQACAEDYSRLRASGDVDMLFADPSFAKALDRARWEGYPRALVMVGSVVEGLLRVHVGEDAHAVQAGLVAMMLENFDRRPVPPVIGDVDWRAARADLDRSLNDLARRPPKAADAVVDDQASFYLAIMPLHQKLGADDFPALRNQLKLSLLQIQEAFPQRVDLATLAGELAARTLKVEASVPESEVSLSPQHVPERTSGS